MDIDTETDGHEAEAERTLETSPETVSEAPQIDTPQTLDALHPRLASAVDGWWAGNLVGGEEWQIRQSYARREDLKNVILNTLKEGI